MARSDRQNQNACLNGGRTGILLEEMQDSGNLPSSKSNNSCSAGFDCSALMNKKHFYLRLSCRNESLIGRILLPATHKRKLADGYKILELFLGNERVRNALVVHMRHSKANIVTRFLVRCKYVKNLDI